jgi:hypothetical protein
VSGWVTPSAGNSQLCQSPWPCRDRHIAAHYDRKQIGRDISELSMTSGRNTGTKLGVFPLSFPKHSGAEFSFFSCSIRMIVYAADAQRRVNRPTKKSQIVERKFASAIRTSI